MEHSLVVLGKAGFVLFTLGLTIGAVIAKVLNPRMALSAHLTAVQTGPALVAFALFWPYLSVPAQWNAPLAYTLLATSYLLVLGIFWAAVTGASKVLPMAGAGFNATPIQEKLVSAVVMGSSVVMLLCCIVICYFALI